MINNNSVVADKECTAHHVHRICWSAIIAGTLVGLGLGFLLQLYGTAIHLSAYSATQQGAYVVAFGGFLGMLVGVIAATATSGFVAGYLGRFHYHPPHGGIIYGFITWSFVIFLSAIMVAPIASFVSSYVKSLSYAQGVEISSVSVTKDLSKNDQYRVNKQEQTIVNKPVDMSAKELAWSGWIVFILFFIGAISSCVGASYGMRCSRENCHSHL